MAARGAVWLTGKNFGHQLLADNSTNENPKSKTLAGFRLTGTDARALQIQPLKQIMVCPLRSIRRVRQVPAASQPCALIDRTARQFPIAAAVALVSVNSNMCTQGDRKVER